MLRSSLVVLPLLALFAGGCTVSSLLNKIEAESDKVVDLVCDCGLETIDGMSCEDTFSVSLFGDADRDCVEDALNTDKAASKEYLECSLDVMKEYTSCIEDNLECDDSSSYQGCAEIFMKFGECPQVPDAVNMEASKCFPNDAT